MVEDDLPRLEAVAPAVPGLDEVAGEDDRGVGPEVSMARQAGSAGVVAKVGHPPRSTPEGEEHFRTSEGASRGARHLVIDTS
jgi:hypothetical protein